MKRGDVKKVSLGDMMPNELTAEAMKLKKEIAMRKLTRGAGKEKNTRQVFTWRKRLARVLTELNKKAIIRS